MPYTVHAAAMLCLPTPVELILLCNHSSQLQQLRATQWWCMLLFHFQRSEDPLTRRQSKLAEMRSKAASAAAAAAAQLAASQSDSERSAFLAQRMLHNMQKAEQRRFEAQQAQRARLAAKKELIMTRLVGVRWLQHTDRV